MSLTDKTADEKPVETACNCAAIRQAARRVTRLYDHALAPSGLRITQLPILSWLAASGPMSMNILADKVGVDRATLGHNLRPLEARGLVTMEAGSDRRSRIVVLTEPGRRKIAEALPAWKAAQTAFEAAFGKQDSAALRATMLRLARVVFPVAISPPRSQRGQRADGPPRS